MPFSSMTFFLFDFQLYEQSLTANFFLFNSFIIFGTFSSSLMQYIILSGTPSNMLLVSTLLFSIKLLKLIYSKFIQFLNKLLKYKELFAFKLDKSIETNL